MFVYTDVSGESKENATLGQRPSFIHPTAVVHPDAVLGQVMAELIAVSCLFFPRLVWFVFSGFET